MASLKQKLRARERTIGSWLNLGNATVAEIMADAGFEWLVIDLEHTTTTLREAEQTIRVIDLKGVAPLVRLTSNDANQAKRLLDAGAHGIIVPMVLDADGARDAVAAVRYPPSGRRGVGLGRAQRYGFGFEEYLSWLDRDAVIVIQIEHATAVENLEAILSIEGIDATMIGPYDLSASVGKAGRFEDPAVASLLARYEDVSQRCGRAMGAHVVQPDHAAARRHFDKGYSMVALGVDFLYLGTSCRRELSALRAPA